MACDAAEPIHPASHVVTPLFDDCGLRAFLTEVRNGSPSSQTPMSTTCQIFHFDPTQLDMRRLLPCSRQLAWVSDPLL